MPGVDRFSCAQRVTKVGPRCSGDAKHCSERAYGLRFSGSSQPLTLDCAVLGKTRMLLHMRHALALVSRLHVDLCKQSSAL